ncbi:MAG: undecaprenyl-diphosphate phosphatase [Flavobacteriales bacterium]|jgi:undecaprenyl-diphosphatase|nr:undecaprenyl-diphosphate phosphatase [Flavobacteriales bacterium]
MELLEAIILGIIQGLTEFLPVSSSGHIELAKAIFGTTLDEDKNLLFTIILHFATALSTVVVFRKDILDIFKGLLKFENNESFQFSLKVVLSMIPAASVGVFLEEYFDKAFAGNLPLIGLMLIITAVLLYFADKAKDTGKPVSTKDAIIIGVSQAIAILPGISRSGATISTSVLLGNDRAKAARFSFLMVIPLILGAMLKKALDLNSSHIEVDYAYLGVGFIAAFFTGLLACNWMIKLVKNSKLVYFSVYCLIVGLIALLYSLA